MKQHDFRCAYCKRMIEDEEKYFDDDGIIICEDDLERHISQCYDFEEIADDLGIGIHTYKAQKPEETENTQPIDGQIDMFGGTYHGGKENELPYAPVADHG